MKKALSIFVGIVLLLNTHPFFSSAEENNTFSSNILVFENFDNASEWIADSTAFTLTKNAVTVYGAQSVPVVSNGRLNIHRGDRQMERKISFNLEKRTSGRYVAEYFTQTENPTHHYLRPRFQFNNSRTYWHQGMLDASIQITNVIDENGSVAYVNNSSALIIPHYEENGKDIYKPESKYGITQAEACAYTGREHWYDYFAVIDASGKLEYEIKDITGNGAVIETNMPIFLDGDKSSVTADGQSAIITKRANSTCIYDVLFTDTLGEGIHIISASLTNVFNDEPVAVSRWAGIDNPFADKAYYDIFKMDFENYEDGSLLPLGTGDVYSSSVQHNPDIWSGFTEGHIDVQTIEKNNVVRGYNNTDKPVTADFSKMLRIADVYSPRFSISFKVLSDGSGVKTLVTRYGGTNGTEELFRMSGNGDVYIRNSKVKTVDTDRWVSLKLDISIPENIIAGYVDSELVYVSKYLSGDIPDDGSYYNLKFLSELSSAKSVYWDDVVISSIDIKNNLENYKGVHPRLFFSEDDFEKAEQNIKSDKMSDEWNALKSYADKLIANGPKKYTSLEGEEDLWMRECAKNIEQLCIVYKLSNEDKYKTAATEFVKAAMSYPSWGHGKTYENKDLAAAHMIKALSCYYDWLYNDLDYETDLLPVYNILLERVPKLNGWWNMSYVQNHLWRNAGAWYAAAIALYDEYDGAERWFNEANQWYRLINKYLPSDGGNHESFMYWTYGMDGFMAYAHNSEKFHNIDLFENTFFKKTANYAMETILPTAYNGSDNQIFKIADHGDTSGTEWVGIMTWLATKNQDSVAQWWVDKYSDLYEDGKEDYAMNYIMHYDFDLKAVSPEEANRPLNYLFDDLGMFFMRSDYSDNATCLTYRCGPALGKNAFGYYSDGDLGTGHIHSDINSLQIYANGEHLLGETQYGGVATASHNTILINGTGQWGDLGYNNVKGKSWNVNPRIIKLEETENYVYSVGNGTEAYYSAEETGLENWNRHFLWLKDDILIVLDDIQFADENASADIRWWPESQNGIWDYDGSCLFSGKASNLRINIVNPENKFITRLASETKVMGSTNTPRKLLMSTGTTGSSVVPAVLSWSKAGEMPDRVICEKIADGIYNFYTENKTVRIDINKFEVKIFDNIIIKTKLPVEDKSICGFYNMTAGEVLESVMIESAATKEIYNKDNTVAKKSDTAVSGMYIRFYNTYEEVVLTLPLLYAEENISLTIDGGEVTASGKAYTDGIDYIIIAAQYDGSRLVDLSVNDIIIENNVVRGSSTVDFNAGENYTVKGFIWKKDSLMPVK